MANGQDILNLGAQHVGERYVLGVLVPKDNPNWHGPWDCAEFVSWCVFQTIEQLFGCNDDHGRPAQADAYTGFWQRDAATILQRVSRDQAAQTPGALLLRNPQPNLIGHIAIADGQGGTVEAHSTATGVIRGVVAGRRWDTGILLPNVNYAPNSTPVDTTPPPLIFRLTTPMMQGAKVSEIQTALRNLHFDPGPIDGIYGPRTVAAVNAFQLTEGLLADGEVGPETARALHITLT
jgi:N-acetylmuramoyl-L-alanine amidase